MLSRGSRIFVGLVFTLLGASFIATTAVFVDEYRGLDWFGLGVFFSHMFVFYATFGLVALAAFYIPCCVFTDMYWAHVRHGRLRFLLGFAVLIGITWVLTTALLAGNERVFWEIKPEVLRADRSETVACGTRGEKMCRRTSALEGLRDVREISQSRWGLAPFGRDCANDPLVELPESALAKRYCFPSRSMETAASCCQVQAAFARSMTRLHDEGVNRSRTGELLTLLLPFKVFFLLVLLVVGILLAVRRRGIDQHYGALAKHIETGVLTGAAVMLFWPVMNHAYLQSAAVLYGSQGDSLFRVLGPGFSLLFGGWALLLLFFFHRRYEKSLEAVGKIAGLLASAIAVLQYDNIVNYAVRIAGSGADEVTIGVLVAIGVLALVQLIVRISSRDGQGLVETGLGPDASDTSPLTNDAGEGRQASSGLSRLG
ncbi:MAG: hypothetical protein AAFZ01_09635 [Pseudomonadota bacterium]